MPKDLPPKITREEEKHYTDEMHMCLRDFAVNEFQIMRMFHLKGVDYVFNIIKDTKLKTFKEYLNEKRGGNLYGTITEEEEHNPVMQGKTKELDSLILKINHNIDLINGEETNTDNITKKMTQEELDKILHRVLEITNSPYL